MNSDRSLRNPCARHKDTCESVWPDSILFRRLVRTIRWVTSLLRRSTKIMLYLRDRVLKSSTSGKLYEALLLRFYRYVRTWRVGIEKYQRQQTSLENPGELEEGNRKGRDKYVMNYGSWNSCIFALLLI